MINNRNAYDSSPANRNNLTDLNSSATSKPGVMDLEFHSDQIDFSSNNFNNLSKNIENSENYKIAYTLFSEAGAHGEKYLSMLQAIPGKYVSAINAWWEQAIHSNKAAESNRLSYQAAMTEIGNLIASFYEFVNTLPEEQAEQLRQIGHNLGLAGNVTGSQLTAPTSQPVEYNAASSSSELIQGIGTFASTVLSMVNASVAIGNAVYGGIRQAKDYQLKLKEFDLNKDSLDKNFDLASKMQAFNIDKDKKSMVLGFSNLLRSQGYNEAADEVLARGYDELLSSIFDPTNEVQVAQNRIKYIKSLGTDEAFVRRYTEWNSEAGNFVYDGSQIFTDMYNLQGEIASDAWGEELVKAIDLVCDYELKSHFYELKKKYYQSKYSSEYSSLLNSGDAAEADNAANAFRKSQSDLDKEIANFKIGEIRNLIENYKSTNNPITKRYLYETLMNVSTELLMFDEFMSVVDSNDPDAMFNLWMRVLYNSYD